MNKHKQHCGAHAAFHYSMTALADGTQSAVVDVVGPMGYDDRQELDFCDSLDRMVAAGVRSITMRVNSPGGFVYTAFPMYDKLMALRAQGVHIRGEVHGEACSAASLLLMACSTVAMTANSGLMVHQPSAIVYGPVDEILAQSKMLADTRTRMFEAYGKRCGKPGAQVDADHKTSVYYTPEAALAYGLIDEIMAAEEPVEKDDSDEDGGTEEEAEENGKPEDADIGDEEDEEEDADTQAARGGVSRLEATKANVGKLAERLGLPVFRGSVRAVATETRRNKLRALAAENEGLKSMLAAARAEKQADTAAFEARVTRRVGEIVAEKLASLGVEAASLPKTEAAAPGTPVPAAEKTASELAAMSSGDLLAYADANPGRVRRWLETGQ